MCGSLPLLRINILGVLLSETRGQIHLFRLVERVYFECMYNFCATGAEEKFVCPIKFVAPCSHSVFATTTTKRDKLFQFV
jgi:hypothetical protein